MANIPFCVDSGMGLSVLICYFKIKLKVESNKRETQLKQELLMNGQ